jgi:LCP family protein required for cell wall assembly
VLGTDVRPEGVPDESGNPTKAKCVDAAASGAVHPDDCLPVRADTLMLVRAGGGAFEKLSIPRDTFAEIPGEGADKINAAYAFGGAGLQRETIENFLGIDIDHVVILDFGGFADFIDALGGVQVALREPVKSKISGGASNGGVTLKLEKGKNDLNGQEALALARTRENLKDASEGDPERAQRQQLILAGIQDRLTSPTRIPYNIIHAPWIAWNAPKAMISDMGGLVLPQLAASAAIGGNSPTKILKPSGATGGGALIVERSECEKAVEEFLGKEGPREPQCSPSE